MNDVMDLMDDVMDEMNAVNVMNDDRDVMDFSLFFLSLFGTRMLQYMYIRKWVIHEVNVEFSTYST